MRDAHELVQNFATFTRVVCSAVLGHYSNTIKLYACLSPARTALGEFHQGDRRYALLLPMHSPGVDHFASFQCSAMWKQPVGTFGEAGP